MLGTKEILKERGSAYGSYLEGCKLRVTLMEALTKVYLQHNNKPMPSIDIVRLYDLVHKLSRLAAAPRHIDSWQDIEGYSKLSIASIKEDMNADQQ